MHKNTDAQTVNLTNLQQGMFMNIVITSAPGSCQLEFKNAGDTAWSVDPAFDGTPSAGNVINERVKCLSAHQRIVFAAPPGAAYWIQTVHDAVPTF